MTTRVETSPFSRPAPRRLLNKFFFLFALIVWGDWLFYGHSPGISFSMFIALLAASIVLSYNRRSTSKTLLKAWATLICSLLPAIENLSWLSGAIGAVGAVIFALIINQKWRGDVLERAEAVAGFLLYMPARLLLDMSRMNKIKYYAPRATKQSSPMAKIKWASWLMPIGFSLIFLALFAIANPLIESWFAQIELFSALDKSLHFLFTHIAIVRVGLWAGLLILCWPFLRVKLAGIILAKTSPDNAMGPSTQRGVNQAFDKIFGEAAIFRALLLFNLLFAVQTGLDITFLWRDVKLPEGVSHAAYAHRGSYTLIFTALLAAAFVLFAVRPGASSARSLRVKLLLVLWTVQNGLLVQSSLLRLGLYVEAFSLTYWRVAALIWMGLVFAGLVFILIKIIFSRSNLWLIKANLLCLACVLYMTSLTNLPAIIADYNVTVVLENRSNTIDMGYLLELGVDAIGAFDKMIAAKPRLKGMGLYYYAAWNWERNRETLVQNLTRETQEWRRWSFRHARLRAYLRHHAQKQQALEGGQ